MNKTIANKALEMAIRAGADSVRILLSEGSSSSISILNGSVDKLQRSSALSLGITLFLDGRFGVFYTNRIDEVVLSDFINNCIASVKFLSPDDCRILPDRSLCYDGKGKDLKQYDLSFDKIPTEKKKEFIMKIASEVDMRDKRIISAESVYEDCADEEYLIDSHGFEATDRQTIFGVSNECSINGDNGSKPQNMWFDTSMFFDTLSYGCGAKSFQRTLQMLGAKKIKSGKYSVVLENTISSKVVAPIIGALSGPSIQQNNSFLLDTLGKKIFPESLTFSEEPHIIGAQGSRYYDSEGLATRPLDIIREGVVETYFLSTYYARKLNMEPTIETPCAPCFKINSGVSMETILQSVDTGILVTGFNGGNCNGATGDFSYGIEGFYFEKGSIVHPIREMNMTGNILSLWKNILFIGNDPRKCVRWQIPTLAFGGVDFSGC